MTADCHLVLGMQCLRKSTVYIFLVLVADVIQLQI